MAGIDRLPSLKTINKADDKLGSFMSDLDSFLMRVKSLLGENVSLADHLFMEKAGITLEKDSPEVDPALLARLLVFADEVLDVAKLIRVDAEKLRTALLWLYRDEVLEPERAGGPRA